jgi:hypothetical protein
MRARVVRTGVRQWELHDARGGRTLGDIDVTPRKAVEGSQGCAHVDSMLQELARAMQPLCVAHRIQDLPKRFELCLEPVLLSDELLQRQLVLGDAVRVAVGRRSRGHCWRMYVVHV